MELLKLLRPEGCTGDLSTQTDRAVHDELVGLVEPVSAAKQSHSSTDTSALERKIDERVFRLYGLTPEEIKLVKEAGK